MAQTSHSTQEALYSVPSSEHSLFTNAPLGIIITTSENRLLSANPSMARIFGYDSQDELIESVNGITAQLYADPSDREEPMRLSPEDCFTIDWRRSPLDPNILVTVALCFWWTAPGSGM